MDFTHNSLADGTTFRVMILIDPYSRECLAAVACRSFRGADVASVLAVVGIDRGALPKKIRVDNRTEFTSKALDHSAYWNQVELDYSRPSRPADNGFVEVFNRTFRREYLSQHWFTDLDEVPGVLAHWRDHYNNHRPHSALGARPPALNMAGEAETTDRSQLDGSGK
jgi:putative transposase